MGRGEELADAQGVQDVYNVSGSGTTRWCLSELLADDDRMGVLDDIEPF
mgnify:FL=1